jgi:hypothetical protein
LPINLGRMLNFACLRISSIASKVELDMAVGSSINCLGTWRGFQAMILAAMITLPQPSFPPSGRMWVYLGKSESMVVRPKTAEHAIGLVICDKQLLSQTKQSK